MAAGKTFVTAFMSVLVAFIFLFSAVPAFATTEDDGDDRASNLQSQVFDQLRAGAGVEKASEPTDPRVIAARVIQVALAGLGIIFTIMLLLSGYWFFTSAGEEEKVTKAKSTAQRAVIGLVITLVAYGIVVYVLGALQGVVQEGEGFFRRNR